MRLPTRIRTLATLLIPLLVTACATAADKKPLRLEEIYTDAGLTGRMPTQLHWSPDGRLLAYIVRADEGERRDLWVVNPEAGEKRVLVSYEQLTRLAPPAEQAARDEIEVERLLRYNVAAYVWAPDSKSILFTSAGQLYLFNLEKGEATLLAPGKRGVRDPKFSPDGKLVSFLYQHDLWAVPVTGEREKRLTVGGSADLLHGELDWVYPEELGLRTAYHWSPDSRRILFLESDQSSVPTYPLPDLVDTAAPVTQQRYPKAGDPNPRVRLGIVDVPAALARPDGAAGVETVWLDRTAEYLARFQWVDAARVAVQLLDRAQKRLELVVAEAATGRGRTLFVEEDRFWINLGDDLTFLPDGKTFLWTSEASGFRHIYRYSLDGTVKERLTSGEWEVGAIEGVDEANGWVYYTANERNPLGSDLYRVNMTTKERQLLTEGSGTHTIAMNPTATAYADTYSGLLSPPVLRVHHLRSDRSTEVHASRRVDNYDLVQPELLELKAPDGALVRGMLVKPAALTAGTRYPVVMHVYGGPHSPTIGDAWRGERFLFHQYLVQQGYVVLYVDDRASSRLGHKYEAALYRNYGPTALADHRVAVEWLRAQPYVDPERIALWGWSGGGFATCFGLTHSELFKVGIAGAPVTDWRLYDSIYTERYMGLPQLEPEAYRKTSCIEAAGKLHGRLLLIHGDADDNVHIQNSVQLIHALVEAGKPYDLLVYPGKTHSVRGGTTQLHLYRSLVDYLKHHL